MMHIIHQKVEETLSSKINRVCAEQMSCKMIKAGSELPSSEEVLDLIRKLRGDGRVELDTDEFLIMSAIASGLLHLLILVTAKERM